MKQNYTTALTLSIPEHGRRLADRVGVVEHLQIFVRFNFGSVEISARRMPHPTTSIAHLAYFVGYTPLHFRLACTVLLLCRDATTNQNQKW